MTDLSSLQYTSQHEWLEIVDDVATLGITDYAAEQLGDVVFVDLPDVGSTVTTGEAIGEIESTKSVSELYAPVSGEVIEINDAVDAGPDLVNSSPFEDGWLLRIRVTDVAAGLLDRDAYVAMTGAQS
ncbi:glycine cleavage system protein GcvH [Ruania suaedae]|uniref:glycine cleavage system protein GcvH n=1 Tax=Ruania suaedae TaxID=2897774 RepID=UPI001E56B0D7|nr:glycine cleavage system protein GcvH [Ruania suaedae]UFU03219.1 glycine cleavage system protein GcvH [Ruania suaedae]